ncbi:diamine N-acetyltransferase [Gracilibacillus ureilyticus]|uniref:Diamine N-acetyltransferase n=1 Tax=Gracilibacillus ureilyticus TaxID=531814 RepID=A0A1H9TVU4_9BACI|nr:GNAT family N-acetyltransferase [Gracilibacillus ureilyticus]SES01172.1 diamine N-acetyltransferase [Gracilibacillus ureilyticus]
MNIDFKKIDKNNYKECFHLNVKKEQSNFVAPNWYSLLEVHYEDGERYPLGIYDGETMVGFLMYVFHPADEEFPKDSWWIERFMIDEAYQNKGYGASALRNFITFFKNNYNEMGIRISTEPTNKVAIHLYESVGFTMTGEMVGDEAVLYLDL